MSIATTGAEQQQQQQNQRAQETVLQAVALIRNDLENSKQNQIEQSFSAGSSSTSPVLNVSRNAVNANGTSIIAQPTTNASAIPQELTTMSDNDLISYINPSCFDQGSIYYL